MNTYAQRRRPKGFFVNSVESPFFSEIFHNGGRSRLEGLVDFVEEPITPENFLRQRREIEDAEILVGTWGFPCGIANELAALPGLRLVLYAGGSTRGFAKPFLERDIPVVSAREVNAQVVAEFCQAQVLLANKGYFRNVRQTRDPLTAHPLVAVCGPGNRGTTVALLGYGAIGRILRKLLSPLPIEILVVDPTISEEQAATDGVRLVNLEEAFSTAQVVSNHLPDFPDLKHCLKEQHFAAMREGSTFINTGRGAQVDEAGLIGVLRARPDLTALLDVTYPEPPEAGSAFYTLPNVLVSSHIAGVIGKERDLLVETIAGDLERHLAGSPLLHAIDRAAWEGMA